MAKVASRSVMVALFTYIVMGVSGFITYGPQIQSNILLNFTAQLQYSVLLLIGFLGTLVGVLFSFPMSIFPCRGSLEATIYGNEPPPRMVETCIAVLLVLLTLIVALLVPSLAVVFGLTGSTCGACIAFIFPGVFVLRLLDGSITDVPAKRKGVFLVVTGLIIAVLGTTVSVYQLCEF